MYQIAFVGIDPGQDPQKPGGIACITQSHMGVPRLEVWDMPLLPKGKGPVRCNEAETVRLLREIDEKALHVVCGLEVQQAAFIPTDRAEVQVMNMTKSSFTKGDHFGFLRAVVLFALGWQVERLNPRKWKNAMIPGKHKDKPASCRTISELYPGVELVPPRCRNPRDGRAEAGLIAEYVRRTVVPMKAGAPVPTHVHRRGSDTPVTEDDLLQQRSDGAWSEHQRGL